MMEEGVNRRSGFLIELMTALGTRDLLFTGSTLQPQQHPTLRTFEKFVFLPVLLSADKLRTAGFDSGSKGKILLIFLNPPGRIPGKHAENRNDIQSGTGQ